ncbi:Protein artemis [Arachnomyces sp. PD_36]|nr:Protein artemis [Arachnomyces sp. PD_36]
MNFSKGILETRKQHYKHLANILRPIPLQVPTEIELTPRNRIRVTLFDANHCIGAVMFLIEGGGKAVLYTGDIRAETWWVNSLVRNPVLIPYTLGNKRLDKIYLDTTFATTSNIYRTFPSKAEGIHELLQKVGKYPESTVFYFRSWTFGYEEVWLALSAALNTPVHVDGYQFGLYKSLAVNYGAGFGIHEAPYLYGFKLGNSRVSGCLTNDQDSRVHSCEPGLYCSTISSRPSVFICPIVNRARDGSKVPEHGVGGGGGDLYQSHELELPDEFTLQQLETLCREQIKDEVVFSKTMDALTSAFNSEGKKLSLDTYGLKAEDEIPLKELVMKLSRGKPDTPSDVDIPSTIPSSERKSTKDELPKSIEFPYSRHSSYDELLELVEAFRPKDVFPCTVDASTWRDGVSMQNLFGHLCSGKEFVHDRHMRETVGDQDRQWSPNKPLDSTPEPDSVPRTDETESRELQTTSQSFASTIIHAVDSQPPEQTKTPRIANTATTTRDDVEVPSSTNSPNSQRHSLKRTREMISSSPSSSSYPYTQLETIGHAMKALRARRNSNITSIPQNEESSPLTHQTAEEDPNRLLETTTVTHPDMSQVDFIEISDDDDEPSNNTEHDPKNQPLSQENNNQDEDTEPEIESQNTLISYSAFGSQSFSGDVNTSPRSILRRVETFKSARSGTFSDWADFAPVSSGNNHTEEEIEL